LGLAAAGKPGAGLERTRPASPSTGKAPAKRVRFHCAHDRADQVRTAWIERYEQFRVDCTILVPQMYLLALGRRMGVRPW
jgi:hypothetical protein